MPPMGDGTDVPSADPRSFIWWRGVPICRRPTLDPSRTKRGSGKHLRGGVWLTDAQLEVYRALRHNKIPVTQALGIACRTPPRS
jgi:hypothetical protein